MSGAKIPSNLGKFTLYVPFLPPTMNEVIRIIQENPHDYFRLKAKYQGEVELIALSQYRQISGEVSVRFTWYLRSKKRDLDNCLIAAKCILDALVKVGIIEDDCIEICSNISMRFIHSSRDGASIEIWKPQAKITR